MAESNNAALAPFYYRDNYLRLCDTVEAQYGDILSAAESAFLQTFRRLDFKAQCLYVRLISRTGPWFRESKLAYDELGPIPPILDTLLANEMVEEADELSVQELGKLFTRSELLQVFRPEGQAPPRGKPALLDAIEALQLDAGDTLAALATLDDQRIVAPCGAELTEHLQLLFFGNRWQSLTDFVLQDLGLTRYYPYPLDKAHRLFCSREALDEYVVCANLSDAHYTLVDAGEYEQLPELAAALANMNIQYGSSEKRWHRLCNNVARDLERIDECELALQLYCRSQRHPARERRARILETTGDWAGARDLCDEILQQPWCEAEKEAAERILPRVNRKLSGARQSRRRDTFASSTLTIARGSGSVEELTAAHLLQQWQSVHYVENALMNTLFGLAFWEQIFEPVPGVFHNPFQSAPTDMYDRAFRIKREPSLAARMQQLREEDLATTLVAAYQRYQHYECRWTHWRYIPLELVADCARVIPAEHLLAIWERILFDPAENRRGFPDLIALGAGAGEYCLIEVKGPGDALQDSQKRWLRYFQAHDIPAEVAWVQWYE
jgi:VRR-NUC domain-containing protein/Fanconi-associated nuclease 1-like protein/Fanconi anemia protein nuclease-like protein